MRYYPRRKDKIQELVCQSYEKFIRDEAAGKEIKKQDYKCFITRRAKEWNHIFIHNGNERSISFIFYKGTMIIIVAKLWIN
jgi:hypothetical protein